LPGEKRGDHPGCGVAGPHPHAGLVRAKGRLSRKLQDEFPELRKRYWGQHLWARGYFCASVGAVDEEMIRKYIESQKWDDDDQGFKITAATEP
jgi:REP element-mobilizing transposase RayT